MSKMPCLMARSHIKEDHLGREAGNQGCGEVSLYMQRPPGPTSRSSQGLSESRGPKFTDQCKWLRLLLEKLLRSVIWSPPIHPIGAGGISCPKKYEMAKLMTSSSGQMRLAADYESHVLRAWGRRRLNAVQGHTGLALRSWVRNAL